MYDLPPRKTKPARGSMLDAVQPERVPADSRSQSLLDMAGRPKRTPRIDLTGYAPPRAAYDEQDERAAERPSSARGSSQPVSRKVRDFADDHDEDPYDAHDGDDKRRPREAMRPKASWLGRMAARFTSEDDAADEPAPARERRHPDDRRQAARNDEPREALSDADGRRDGMHDAGARQGGTQGDGSGGDKPLVDLRLVITSVWRLRALIIVTTVLGTIAGVMLAISTPNQYVATSKLYVDPREMRLTDSDLSKQTLATEGILAVVDSQMEVLRSRGVLEKVAIDLGLERDAEFGAAAGGSLLGRVLGQGTAGTAPGTGGAVAGRTLDALAKAVTVGRDPKTFIITIDVKSREPAKSALVANRLVDTFLAEEQAAQSAFYRRTTEALDVRLEELRKDLDAAENAVEAYKASNDIVGANGQLISEKELFSLNDQVSAARSRIAEAKAKVDVASRIKPDAVIGGNFPEEVNSLTLTELRKQFASAKTALGALEANLGPRHPQRLAAAQSVETARNEIANELNRIGANARAELARAEQAERDLVNQLNSQKTRQITASASYVELRDLERSATATRAIYESFLKRARETSEEQKLADRNIRVISKAEPPLQPVGPSRKLIAVAGLIGGLFFGIGVGILVGIIGSIRPLFDQVAASRSSARSPRRATRAGGGSKPLGRRANEAAAWREDERSAPPARRDGGERRREHGPDRRDDRVARDERRDRDDMETTSRMRSRDEDRGRGRAEDWHDPRDHDPERDRHHDWDRDGDYTPARGARLDRDPPVRAGLAPHSSSSDAVEALLAGRRIMEAEATHRANDRYAAPIDDVQDDLRALRHRVEAYVRRQAGGRG